jgi:broad specificity phosphatase PhoE
MLKIYLARHGQDKDNVNGILNGHRNEPLTELGLEQARTVAKEIKNAGIGFDAVYSSPLQRAYKTAETITETLGIEKPIVDPDLIERDFGVMTGKAIRDIKALCAPDIIETPHTASGTGIVYFISVEGSETFPELIARGKRLIEKMKSRHNDGSVLLVAHGDIGKMIYAAYYNLDWKEVLMRFHFGNSELLLLSEDSSPEDTHVFRFEQHNH